MNWYSYGRYLGSRKHAGPHTREHAVQTAIGYLFLFLPRLLYWRTIRLIALALWNFTELINQSSRRLADHQNGARTVSTQNPEPDDVAEQLRAYKRRQRGAATEDWDGEWARLVDPRSDQSREATVPIENDQHQPVESPTEDVLIGVVVEELPPDFSGMGISRTVADSEELQETGDAQTTPEDHKPNAETTPEGHTRDDAHQLLAGDPRTMWAWADYQTTRTAMDVSFEAALQVLAAIPPGDHVEIFGAVTVYKSILPPKRSKNALPPEARFVARTFDTWILPSSGKKAETIPAADTRWYSSTGGSMVDRVAENDFSMPDARKTTAYADQEKYKRFHEGAGGFILRLPDSPQTPVPPELGIGLLNPSPEPAHPSRLLRDWRSAEDVALRHMSGSLGFFGSRLTGGVSDRGVDVEHPEAVAQVKMQANPVGSPQIRQLRGARPHLKNHVFYSTSGYTRAAIDEAADIGVALFIMDDDATVHPHGGNAERLILEGHQRHGGDDALVAEYVSSVTKRVLKAMANYGSDEARWVFFLGKRPIRDKHSRAEGYLKSAAYNVRQHPRIGVESHKAIISHFRNADLKAAFFCHVLDLPYPGEEPIREKRRPTAEDFY